MSKEKRRVPKLRFPGFTEDWEQRKLGDVTNIKTGSRNQQDSVTNGQYPFFIRSEKIEKLDRYDFDTEAILVPGDGRIGEIFHYYNGKFALHQRVYKVDNFKGVDAFFLLYLFQCSFKEHALRLNAQGTVPSLRLPMFTEWNICIPSLQEQIGIGRLLNKIELMITLHQRKLDNLKLKKKALLQKLFPKNGEYYPELRFPGFTDAWEQRKLTDIAKTFIGLVTTMTENYRDSGTLLIRNSDIKEGQFIFSEKPIHLDEEFAEKNKTRRLQIGDVVTVHTGEIGTSAVIKEKEAGAIGFATINTRTDKRILNPYFLSTYFNTDKHKCYANSVSTGDGRSNYNIKDFNKLVISIPTLDEQEKISAIINNINTIITLHQRKLDHLQLQKKALLQQMFV